LDFWLSAAYSAYSYLIPALFFDFGFLQHIVLIPALFLAYSGLIFRFLLSAAKSVSARSFSWLSWGCRSTW
jgi:hypothetical protein